MWQGGGQNTDVSKAALFRLSGNVFEFCEGVEYTYDVARFTGIAERVTAATPLSELEEALTLYGKRNRPFLFQLDNKRSAKFQTWVQGRRVALEAQYHTLVQELSTRYLLRADWQKALDLLQVWLEMELEDPQVEISQKKALYAKLMLCYGGIEQGWPLELTYNQYTQYVQEASDPKSPEPFMQQLRQIIREAQRGSGLFQERVAGAIKDRDIKIPPWVRQTLGHLFESWGVSVRTVSLEESVGFQRVIQRAEAIARQDGWRVVSPSHLFLALCGDVDPSVQDMDEAMRNLSDHNVGLVQVAQAVRDVLGKPIERRLRRPKEDLGLYTVKQEARNRAASVGADTLGVSHLWWAILSRKQDILHDILLRYGLQPDELRTQ